MWPSDEKVGDPWLKASEPTSYNASKLPLTAHHHYRTNKVVLLLLPVKGHFACQPDALKNTARSSRLAVLD